jgi:hypothetical protein
MLKAVSIALACISLILYAGCLHAQQYPPYTSNVNSCITGAFYDSKMYNWYAYPNNCTDRVNVTWVSRNGLHGGGLEIRPGKNGNIGLSEREVEAMGGVLAYACPEHYQPVDQNDKHIAKPVSGFRCKYQGF